MADNKIGVQRSNRNLAFHLAAVNKFPDIASTRRENLPLGNFYWPGMKLQAIYAYRNGVEQAGTRRKFINKVTKELTTDSNKRKVIATCKKIMGLDIEDIGAANKLASSLECERTVLKALALIYALDCKTPDEAYEMLDSELFADIDTEANRMFDELFPATVMKEVA